MAKDKLAAGWLLDLGQAVAPLHPVKKGITRTLRLCGADYEDMVTQPGHERAGVEVLLKRLHERRREWDICDFRFLLPQSVLLTHFTSVNSPFKVVVWPFRTFYQVQLPNTWEEYEVHIGKKLAYQMRSAAGKRSREFASSELRISTASTLDQDVDALIALHTGRWEARGETGIFSTQEVKEAVRQVCRNFLALDQLRLYTLWLDGKPASALFSIADEQRIHYYISGFDPQFKKYHPTKVLLAEAMKDGVRLGPREFDFIKGAEEYKLDWANSERMTSQMIVVNNTPHGRLSLLYLNLLRKHKLLRAASKPKQVIPST